MRVFKVVFLAVLFTFLFLPLLYSQPGGGGPPNNPPPPDVPITGIEILIGTGLLLGVKKLIGKNSKKQ